MHVLKLIFSPNVQSIAATELLQGLIVKLTENYLIESYFAQPNLK